MKISAIDKEKFCICQSDDCYNIDNLYIIEISEDTKPILLCKDCLLKLKYLLGGI